MSRRWLSARLSSLMGVESVGTTAEFAAFVAEAELRLRRALVATYGVTVGRDATVDALSWAWEHWDRVRGMDNSIGYLYRVGQSAAARWQGTGNAVTQAQGERIVESVEFAPELMPALARLTGQQRAAVVLVHGYSMTLREVAECLGVSVATVRAHEARGMKNLRRQLQERTR